TVQRKFVITQIIVSKTIDANRHAELTIGTSGDD
ncbi:MAG: hypothetical protein RLZZ628_3847, partial [Bacteroidota bacterium]